jgi:hypothetical protein
LENRITSGARTSLRLFLTATLALVMQVVAVGGTEPKEDNSLRRRLFAEAPQSWQNWREAMLHSSGEVRYLSQVVAIDGKKLTKLQKRESSFALAGHDKRRIVVNQGSSTDNFFATGRNATYDFNLIGFGPPDQRTWRVKTVDPRTSSPQIAPDPENPPDRFDALVSPVLYGPFTLLGYDLGLLIKDPTFALANIHWGEAGDKNLVDVTISGKLPFPRRWDGVVDSAHILLEPENGWAVRKVLDLHPGKNLSWEIEITYSDHPTSPSALRLPVLLQRLSASVKTTAISPRAADEMTDERFIVDSLNLHQVDDKEFTLSSFGLTEPVLGELAHGKLWGIVIVNVGVLLLVITLFLARRRFSSRSMQ